MPARPMTFVERVTLFLTSLDKATSEQWLFGFVEPKRYNAFQFKKHVAHWASATRQARLALEFGLQPDAAVRLQEVYSNASPRLRAAITEVMPIEYRSTLQPLDEVPPRPSPALRARAKRLVHEALR